MLDLFLTSHPPLVYRDQSRERLWNRTFTTARAVVEAEIPLPDMSLLDGRPSFSDYANLARLQARKAIRPFTKWRRQPDFTFVELVLYHDWYGRSPEKSTLRSALGVHVQSRLTKFLCDVDPRQWKRLYRFGPEAGLHPNHWFNHLAGASAAAYVAMSLCARPDARVFLSHAHEDVQDNTDLFWIEGGWMHAVSVKSDTWQRDQVRAWYVHERPPRSEDDPLSMEQLDIFMGADRFSKRDGRPCLPVLVHVRRPQNGPVDLTTRWERLNWPDRVIHQIKQRHRQDLLEYTAK